MNFIGTLNQARTGPLKTVYACKVLYFLSEPRLHLIRFIGGSNEETIKR